MKIEHYQATIPHLNLNSLRSRPNRERHPGGRGSFGRPFYPQEPRATEAQIVAAARAAVIEASHTLNDLPPENPSNGSLLTRLMESPYARALSLLIMGGAASSLLAACSSTPPAIIQESPTPSPTLVPTAQVCAPDVFATQHGYPTPVGLGGNEENNPDQAFRQMLKIREKLDTCQILTPDEETAVIEFNQEHPSLPDVVSKETAQFATPSPAEIQRMQEEAAARGEFKLFSPAEILQIGGGITQSRIYPNNQRNLFISFPSGITVTLPALVSGEVLEAARVNSFTNSVQIKSGGQIWGFGTPRTSKLLVKKGQLVAPGIPLLEVRYNPTDPIQQGFETQGFGQAKATVISIGRQDIATKKFQQVTLGALFMTPDNALVTVSSTPGK
ncbi:hypothetical protein KKE78_03890 [Patescibacteria group bacterium]|nr:hypothetical protein [Patescibacteria group bacterium]